MHLLVVEDEAKLAAAVREGLEREGYIVTVAHSGEEGFYLLCSGRYDLVVLDVMLPGRDGLEILAVLRQRGMAVPVIIVTAKDALDDRVRGLDSGADDYLIKPFAFPELLARIRALARRPQSETPLKLQLADLEMDPSRRWAGRGGKDLELTAREFSLLEYLLRHANRVVSREMLASEVWKERARHTPLDNVIDVHIAHLRRKMDEPFGQKLLHTVRGVGFVLREEPR